MAKSSVDKTDGSKVGLKANLKAQETAASTVQRKDDWTADSRAASRDVQTAASMVGLRVAQKADKMAESSAAS